MKYRLLILVILSTITPRVNGQQDKDIQEDIKDKLEKIDRKLDASNERYSSELKQKQSDFINETKQKQKEFEDHFNDTLSTILKIGGLLFTAITGIFIFFGFKTASDTRKFFEQKMHESIEKKTEELEMRVKLSKERFEKDIETIRRELISRTDDIIIKAQSLVGDNLMKALTDRVINKRITSLSYEKKDRSVVGFSTHQEIKCVIAEKPVTELIMSFSLGNRAVISDAFDYDEQKCIVTIIDQSGANKKSFHTKLITPLTANAEPFKFRLRCKIYHEFADDKNCWVIQKTHPINEDIFELEFYKGDEPVATYVNRIKSLDEEELMSSLKPIKFEEGELVTYQYTLPKEGYPFGVYWSFTHD